MRAAGSYFLDHSTEMTMVMELRNVLASAKSLPNQVTAVLHPFRKESQVWHTTTSHRLVFEREPRNNSGEKVEKKSATAAAAALLEPSSQFFILSLLFIISYYNHHEF